MHDTGRTLAELASIFVVGVGAQWVAWRLKLPSILLLLFAGFLVGPVTGFLDPDSLFGDLLFPFVSLSVALILFEGGLSLRFSELKETWGALGNLVTVGAIISLILTAIAARVFLGFPWSESILLGAILVVTGPTVVGPLLTFIRPKGKVAAIAKWEGIVIDPIGALLAVLVYEVINQLKESKFEEITQTILISSIMTLLASSIIAVLALAPYLIALKRFWIPDALQSPMLLMTVFAAFTASNLIQEESGLLTVTFMGLVFANQPFVKVRHIIEFKENLRVLLLSGLFVLLAARVKRTELLSLGLGEIAFVMAMILIVRPVSVWLSTWRQGLTWQEKTFLSWMAPRGIVAASVAAIFALRIGPSGEKMVPVVFALIVATVTVYGLTAGPLARRLGLADSNPQGVLIASAHPGARAIAKAIKSAGFRVLLVDKSPANIRQAKLEGLDAYYANILSEQVADELDLGGIGRFIALTGNEEVNSLASLHFADIFGRAEVYQIAMDRAGTARADTAAQYHTGRILFGSDVTYQGLDRRFASGYVVKTTRLTKAFDKNAFRNHYGQDAIPLCVIDEFGRLSITTAEVPIALKAGQSVISLVRPNSSSGSPSAERSVPKPPAAS